MWFGINEKTGIFVVTIDILPYIIVSMWEGTKAVDRDLVSMARVFGASRGAVVRRVYVPHLGPYIFGAVRYGFALAWKIVLVVEIFGFPNGIGSIFEYWYEQFDMTQVFAWTVTFACVILIAENAVIGPARRYAFRWMPDDPTVRTRAEAAQ
jgi:NitT/TauT family transport system permease protein